MASYNIYSVVATVLITLTTPVKAGDYRLRWTAVEHDLTPTRQIVSQGYVARFEFDGSRFSTDENGQKAETTAGQSALFTTKLGTQHAITYGLRGRTIVRTDRFPGFAIVMQIVTSAGNRCQVKVLYRRAAERAAFQSERNDGSGPSTASRVETRDARCTLSDAQP